MKLSDWAKKQGISYLTAYRWFRDGKLPVEAYQSESGTIIIKDVPEPLEQTMASNNQSNDIMSLFLKKTVEFSKNNASVEDFAAYVISNFSLKLSNTLDSSPRYSKNKPKAEDIQKHFQQFLKPKNENLKPIPREFVADSDILEKLGFNAESDSTLNVAFSGATLSETESPLPEMQSLINDLSLALAPMPQTNIVNYNALGDYEGVVSRNNELSPQSINYTSSMNSTFVSPSFNKSSIDKDYMFISSAAPQPAVASSFQPSSEDITNAHKAAEKLVSDVRSVVKAKRGRKPSKKLAK